MRDFEPDELCKFSNLVSNKYQRLLFAASIASPTLAPPARSWIDWPKPESTARARASIATRRHNAAVPSPERHTTASIDGFFIANASHSIGD
jgi:hypothetical protein